MIRDDLEPYKYYRHIKSGLKYNLIAIARLEEAGRTGSEMVVYRSEYDLEVWIRPAYEFLEKYEAWD